MQHLKKFSGVLPGWCDVSVTLPEAQSDGSVTAGCGATSEA